MNSDESSLFRSELMELVQIFVQADAAHDTVAELGRFGLIEFQDLNAGETRRKFHNEVARCSEMERIIKLLEPELQKSEEEAFLPTHHTTEAPQIATLDGIEQRLEYLEEAVLRHNRALVQGNEILNKLKEMYHVLTRAQELLVNVIDLPKPIPDAPLLTGQSTADAGGDLHEPLLSTVSRPVDMSLIPPDVERGTSRTLQTIAGTIVREKLPVFERLLFRALRGNLLLRFVDIDDPIEDASTGDPVTKSMFLIFFSGETVRNKVMKICDSFGCNRYSYPSDPREVDLLLERQKVESKDAYTMVTQTKREKAELLYEFQINHIMWTEVVATEKAVYHTMNKFNYDGKCYVAVGWIPTRARADIQESLRIAKEKSRVDVDSVLHTLESPKDFFISQKPPTYFRTNKFTEAFQGIVEAYGTPNYREVNPSLFTIITFPFLFAVMYGDIGHGILMLCFAIFMLWNEKKFLASKQNEIFEMMFAGRYLIFLMSIFSVYVGLMYNEVFSAPLNLFGSSYYIDEHGIAKSVNEDVAHHHVPVFQYNGPGAYTPYPCGVDPAWRYASKNVEFTNSLKMKLSIVLGVSQMFFGLLCKLLNSRHYGRNLDVYYEVIPELVFFLGIFGYLVVMIVIKWNIEWTSVYNTSPDINRVPPLLINVLIDMFMLKPISSDPLSVIGNEQLFPGQATLQPLLVVSAVLAVPVMLIVKPLVLRHRAKQPQKSHGDFEQLLDDGSVSPVSTPANDKTDEKVVHVDDHSHFDFSEIMIHQVIHTIEFVLGSISNTASYLRLWALSLAHTQLSEVFWDYVLIGEGHSKAEQNDTNLNIMAIMGINSDYAIMTFVCFAAWWAMTVGVIMVMESLSAFLHALRLHWVEYQGKFFGGQGLPFTPFSLSAISAESIAAAQANINKPNL